MEILKPGLDFYITLLKQNKPFSFARSGNGEWGGILGIRDRTGSGSQDLKGKAIRRALAESVRTGRGPNYFRAMQSVSYLQHQGMWNLIESWIKNNGSDLKWHDGEVFVRASIRGRLNPLIEQLRKMEVVIVGPAHLAKFGQLVCPIESFIKVRSRDCFQDIKHIRQIVKREAKEGRVFSFSAGPTTKVLIHQLFPDLGQHCFMIDFGSLWDPYSGRKTRRYHKRITPEIIRENLYGH